MKGFSALETIIAITVAGILLAIITNSFQISRIKKNQDEIVETIVSSLEEQKTNSQTGKEGFSYGVKFNIDNFVLFRGEYQQASSNNKIIAIEPQFQISDSLINMDNIVSFSKILGDASENATITISHIDNRISPKNIVIKKTGTISVIE